MRLRAVLSVIVALGAAAPATALASPYADAVTASAPSGWWRLGDAAGPQAADATGGAAGTWNGALTAGAPGALAGDDDTALGFSGYLYTTGYPDRAPVRPSIATADFTTAIFNALATLLALYWRDAQGGSEGQLIDLALYEPLFRISEDIVPAFDKLGHVRERTGNRNPGFNPADNFRTKDDRWIMIAAGVTLMTVGVIMMRKMVKIDV